MVPNYQLTEGPLDLSAEGPYNPVNLMELFGDHDELIVYEPASVDASGPERSLSVAAQRRRRR